jgi:hypothetical protein
VLQRKGTVERNEAEGDGSRSGNNGDGAKARETPYLGGGTGDDKNTDSGDGEQGDTIKTNHKGY